MLGGAGRALNAGILTKSYERKKLHRLSSHVLFFVPMVSLSPSEKVIPFDVWKKQNHFRGTLTELRST